MKSNHEFRGSYLLCNRLVVQLHVMDTLRPNKYIATMQNVKVEDTALAQSFCQFDVKNIGKKYNNESLI